MSSLESIPEATSTISVRAAQPAVPVHASLFNRIGQAFKGDEKKVLPVMEAISRDCLKGLALVQTYLPSAKLLAEAVFPGEVVEIEGASHVIGLIENAVATVEAKWAAGNESSKNGAQKLADVVALVETAVTDMLTQLGVKADTSYVTNLINLVVGVLNLRTTAVVPAA